MIRILIWGTGMIAKQTVCELKDVIIAGFIETEVTQHEFAGYKVFSPDEIVADFDILLIANKFSDPIYSICREKNIDLHKVCFMKKPSVQIDVENNLLLAKEILEDSLYQKICLEFNHVSDDWISRDAEEYELKNIRPSFKIDKSKNYYIYKDRFENAGSIDSYFWQDLWAARKIYLNSPFEHYDIGSRIDGFISHLLTFRDNIFLLDIRPLDKKIEGLKFTKTDATNMEGILDNSIESISALCSLEHFGLGRYGDKIDPEACFKCFEAIQKKVKLGGYVYLSVPIGYEHIEFNAHRVFCTSTIINAFNECDLIEFSCTYNGNIEYNVDIHKYDDDKTLGGTRFGLFQFQKIRI